MHWEHPPVDNNRLYRPANGTITTGSIIRRKTGIKSASSIILMHDRRPGSGQQGIPIAKDPFETLPHPVMTDS